MKMTSQKRPILEKFKYNPPKYSNEATYGSPNLKSG
jgi:hypothetical protein